MIPLFVMGVAAAIAATRQSEPKQEPIRVAPRRHPRGRAHYLRISMQERGWSAGELAHRLGPEYSVDRVRDAMSGRQPADLQMARRLSMVFDNCASCWI